MSSVVSPGFVKVRVYHENSFAKVFTITLELAYRLPSLLSFIKFSSSAIGKLALCYLAEEVGSSRRANTVKCLKDASSGHLFDCRKLQVPGTAI